MIEQEKSPKEHYMQVKIDWTLLDDEAHPLWDAGFCLYAYLHPKRDFLLYIGKSDFSTVGHRLQCKHKDQLFRDIRREYKIDKIRALQGELLLEKGRRRSSELLADIESLLIAYLRPYGNISSTQSRISRLGLCVTCRGDWPFKHKVFYDE